MTPLPPPSKASVDVILKAAPNFDKLRLSPPDSKPVFDALARFVAIVYATDFVVSFDWMQECQKAELAAENIASLDKADIPQLRKLLIAHLRLDRFSEGHLRKLLITGYLEKLIERLRLLRPTM